MSHSISIQLHNQVNAGISAAKPNGRTSRLTCQEMFLREVEGVALTSLEYLEDRSERRGSGQWGLP